MKCTLDMQLEMQICVGFWNAALQFNFDMQFEMQLCNAIWNANWAARLSNRVCHGNWHPNWRAIEMQHWNIRRPLLAGAHGCGIVFPSLLHLPFLPLLLALAGLPGHLQLPLPPIPCTCNCYFPPSMPPPGPKTWARIERKALALLDWIRLRRYVQAVAFVGWMTPTCSKNYPKCSKLVP